MPSVLWFLCFLRFLVVALLLCFSGRLCRFCLVLASRIVLDIPVFFDKQNVL